MKRLLLVVLLASAVAPACVPKDSLITTPEGKRAYTVDQVVKRLGELQSAAIDASNARKISTEDARVVVTFVSGDARAVPPVLGAVDLLNSAATNPNWKTLLLEAWEIAKVHLLNTPLARWVPDVDALLEGVN